MTHRVTRGAAALLASAALTAATATTASAATWSHTDATQDVVEADSAAQTTTTDPSNAVTDITRVDAANNRSTVVVRVRTRAALPFKNFLVDIAVKTSTSRFTVTRGNLFGRSGTELDKGAQQVACKGMTFVIDRTARTAKVTLPRTCLGNPGFIKVGAGVVTMTSTGRMSWADDGLSTRVGNSLTLSPGIAKG
ncbi:MAG TPA: hypothetical protein VN088_04575 [Nocardioides sp.]|nr:hypothetical protein [Nocardioides sp.]